jgi:hypothetical protein
VWFQHKAWIPIAWILCVVNVVSVWFAPNEPAHATAHAALAVLFGLGAQRLASRKRSVAGQGADEDVAGRLGELEAGLADLDKLQGMESRLAELEERLDFTERALVNVKNRAQVPPKE